MNNWVYDKMRKVIYDEGEYYEHSLTTIFARILKFAPPNSRVIDVGGNIGWFTLLSAAHGHHVDVFEPNKVNIIRQCQSMWLNRWTTTTEDEVLTRTTKRGSIHILPYGVGSNTTSMTFFVGKNPGKATTLRDMLPRNKRPRSIEEIPIVTLDSMASDLGWFDQKMPVIILKVDVEGFEPSVFGGAKKLLKAHLIENILMEVTGQMDNTENRVMLQTILDAGYYLYQVGGPEGPSRGYDEFQGSNEDHSQALLDKFTKRHGLQANFWWKVKRDDVVKTER
jgi:FkbM family methyltransferase